MPYEWGESKRIPNLDKHKIDFTETERFDWNTATRELTAEDIARMRPAIEVVPHLVEWSERNKGKKLPPAKE